MGQFFILAPHSKSRHRREIFMTAFLKTITKLHAFFKKKINIFYDGFITTVESSPHSTMVDSMTILTIMEDPTES